MLSKEVTEALKTAGYLPDINGSTRTPSPESPVAGPSGVCVDDGDKYRLALSPLQYEGIEFASKMFSLEIIVELTTALRPLFHIRDVELTHQ